MKSKVLCDGSETIAKLDSIQMSALDHERARQIARRAETLICLSFVAGRVPDLVVARLKRLLRRKIPIHSTPR